METFFPKSLSFYPRVEASAVGTCKKVTKDRDCFCLTNFEMFGQLISALKRQQHNFIEQLLRCEHVGVNCMCTPCHILECYTSHNKRTRFCSVLFRCEREKSAKLVESPLESNVTAANQEIMSSRKSSKHTLKPMPTIKVRSFPFVCLMSANQL